MRTLESVQNPEIKAVAKLKEKKERDKSKLFLAEGLRVITTLLDSNLKLKQLYITQNFLTQTNNNSNNSLINLIDTNLITAVSEEIINKISNTKNSSGIVAVFYQKPEQPKEKLNLKPGLVIAEVCDPGNMGTLIRTAVALKVKNIILVGGVDIWNPKVVKASAGTLGFANIYNLSWPELVKIKVKQDLKLVALVVSGGESIKAVDKNKSLLVIGNEANGLPQEWQKDCDQLITLEMPGKTESLNAAVAGSIALYLTYT